VIKGEDDRKARARGDGGASGFLAGGPLGGCEIGAQTSSPRSPDSKGGLIPASRARLFELANVSSPLFLLASPCVGRKISRSDVLLLQAAGRADRLPAHEEQKEGSMQ